MTMQDKILGEISKLGGTPGDLLALAGRIAAQAFAMQYPDAEHAVRLHLGPDVEWPIRLPDEYTLMVDANGRRYVGIIMPGDDLAFSVVTWDGDPDENETIYPRGNKIDDEGMEYLMRGRTHGGSLYRKCAHCHLFAHNNPAFEDAPGLARYVHSARGDKFDDALDESHEAEAEPGPGAPLNWWKQWGPPAMRARFIDAAHEGIPHSADRGHCGTCGAPRDAVTGKCTHYPEMHPVNDLP